MVDGGQPLFPQVGPLTEVSDQANERRASKIMPAIVTMTIGSWNGTASSDNFRTSLFFLQPLLMGGFRVAHVHAFHTFMCAVLTFWLGHVHALTVSHKLVNLSANKSGFTLEKYSPEFVLARRGQFFERCHVRHGVRRLFRFCDPLVECGAIRCCNNFELHA